MLKSSIGVSVYIFLPTELISGFLKCGACELTLPLKEGACKLKISKFGVCELKISKFRGLRGKICMGKN